MLIRDLCQKGTNIIHDTRVINIGASSYAHRDPERVLPGVDK